MNCKDVDKNAAAHDKRDHGGKKSGDCNGHIQCRIKHGHLPDNRNVRNCNVRHSNNICFIPSRQNRKGEKCRRIERLKMLFYDKVRWIIKILKDED